MKTIYFAVVEDEEIILEDRIDDLKNLRETLDIEIGFTARTKKEFFEKYNKQPDIDALILDIDLTREGDSPQGGLEIAMKVKKPVIFTSGYTGDNIRPIEELEHEGVLVKHLTKPITEARFIQAVKSFCEAIRLPKDRYKYKIKTIDGEKTIYCDDIAYITQGTPNTHQKSFYFINTKPIKVERFSFSEIERLCLPFLRQINQMTIVNDIHFKNGEIQIIDESGNPKIKTEKDEDKILKWSPNYREKNESD